MRYLAIYRTSYPKLPRKFFLNDPVLNSVTSNNSLRARISGTDSFDTMHRFLRSNVRTMLLLAMSTSTIVVSNGGHSAWNDAAFKDSTKLSSYTYNANDPTEDRLVILPSPVVDPATSNGYKNPFVSDSWIICGVFDGHGGWQVSHMASKTLIPQIKADMDDTFKAKGSQDSLKKGLAPVIESSLLSAFKKVELAYLESVKQSFGLGFGEVAKVGSCVLICMQKDKDLFVANCGDCRAVLGTSSLKQKASFTTEKERVHQEGEDPVAATSQLLSSRLTRDHNCRVPLELLTLQQEHPGEEDVVVCKSSTACYVKGRLQLTRALGDAYLKYPEFNAAPNQHRSAGRHISGKYTPPYVKSTPDIAHIRLDTEDKFVIMASDGLWDFLSDQQAVNIVANCLETLGPIKGKAKAAEILANKALDVAAQECGMTLEELKRLPPGRQRRGRHDDTTVVVMFF